ncbi:P-loop containing nucleoside triphosphate hydrolase protein [Haematococcus lacustris]
MGLRAHIVLSLLAASAFALLGQPLSSTSYLSQVAAPDYTVSEYWSSFKPSLLHEDIVATAPDTWEVLPPHFDPNYKNPCWTDPSARFRCLPYFQILGVSKCGTTDLFARLKRHPELAAGSKGPHFWDECPYPPRSACTAPPNGDFDGYTNLFAKGAEQIRSDPRMVLGEASSNTFTGVLTFVRGLAVRKATNITLAQLLREAQPYQRLIVLFRDPVARYYSAFHYYGRRKAQPFKDAHAFHDRAAAEVERWKDCVARRGMTACLKAYEPQQLVKGLYAEFVQAWTSQFPRSQILFLRNEDYQAEPRQHLAAVHHFLGLREPTDEEWVRILGVERTNAQSSRYPRMLPETRALLMAFYQPFNQKLAALLGDDRFLWRDTTQQAATGLQARPQQLNLTTVKLH